MKNILSKLLLGNKKYCKDGSVNYDEMQESQSPKVTMVMCSDSRVCGNVFDFNITNYVFVIENIGNQLSTAKGSVDYGVLHLHTPVLLILGHTGCGAIKAAGSDYSGETEGIIRELDTLQEPLKADGEATAKSQNNVDFQVTEAVKAYKELVDEGKLTVVGALFDLHGHLADEKARIYVTNVNNETDVGRISALVGEELRDCVKRV